MAKNRSTRLKRILKAVKIDRLYYYLQSNLHINKVAVTAEKDLSTLSPITDAMEQAGVTLVAITPETLMQNATSEGLLIYPDKKRLKKIIGYLKNGYRGVAVVRGQEVCGDIWYTSNFDPHKGRVHPDLKWLKFECKDKDVYAFDMYLYPGKRGNNLANLLQNGVLHEIKKNGYARALGCYWAENIPALWVHRTLKWKELRRLEVSRFFGLYHSHESSVCQAARNFPLRDKEKSI